jgi:peptide/nickel transport system ATP-binding protein
VIAEPTREPQAASSLLDVEDLVVHYPVKMPFLQSLLLRDRPVVHAVDGVSFVLQPGEILGLVGESGCGKTTVGRTVLRLTEPTSGHIRFEGIDITGLKEKALRPLRTKIQIIFQDPHASLNPAMSIGRAIGHPLEVHGISDDPEEIRQAVLAIMQEVGLTPPELLYDQYPADLSGGQKQRAVIARAMILRPRLLVADEPVAMLDMSIRARVLELMLDLKVRHGLTYIFITHDLATAKFVCDRIAIMYLGRIVEIGPAKEIYADPKHPYTRALLAAIPVPDPTKRGPKVLPRGEVPDAIRPPAGCRFHPRCPSVLPTCGWEGRDFVEFLEERWLDERTAQAEANLGPIEAWSYAGLEARREAPENVRGIEKKIRKVTEAATPALAAAVASIGLERGDLVVRFRMPDDLRPKSVEGRIVECLLY